MIGIIVAMTTEFSLMESILEDKQMETIHGKCFLRGKIGKQDVVLMQSGIGKVYAAVGAVEMINNYAPKCIINSGVAGGIDANLRIMDIVVGDTVAYHDVWCGEGNEIGQIQGMPTFYSADRALYEAAISVQSDVALCGGLICSGDQFISDKKVLEQIKTNFPAGVAVDMESGAIAQVCHIYNTPFLSCRIISDTPGAVENNALQYNNFWDAAPEKSIEVLKQIIEKI